MSKAGISSVPLSPRVPAWTFRFIASALPRIHGVKNMARFPALVGLGLASTMMMITAPVFAATPAASPTTAARPAAQTVAKPVMASRAATTSGPKRVASTRHNTHLAKATLSNGKKVTYDCRLAGNKNKQACKG